MEGQMEGAREFSTEKKEDASCAWEAMGVCHVDTSSASERGVREGGSVHDKHGRDMWVCSAVQNGRESGSREARE